MSRCGINDLTHKLRTGSAFSLPRECILGYAVERKWTYRFLDDTCHCDYKVRVREGEEMMSECLTTDVVDVYT